MQLLKNKFVFSFLYWQRLSIMDKRCFFVQNKEV